MAQAVSRRSHSAEAPVYDRVSAGGTCGQSGTGRSFLPEFSDFTLSVSFHRGSPLSHIIWGMNNRPVTGCSSETQCHTTDMNSNKGNTVWGFELGSLGSGKGPTAGFCEHGKEPAGSMECKECSCNLRELIQPVSAWLLFSLFFSPSCFLFLVPFSVLHSFLSWVSSGSILSDYGLDDRAIGVRFPAGAKDFSSSLCVQTGSGAHPASCPMGTGGPFPGGKSAAGAWCWPFTPI
jgi:hypothetical protein